MSKQSSQANAGRLRKLLETWTGTPWNVRALEPDGYYVAWSEVEGDAIKLVAKDFASAVSNWPIALRLARWNELAA